MNAVKRYCRMYFALVRFSASRAMEFRLDFYFRFFMDCVYYAINIAFFKLLYLHTATLGGWREDQALIFIALAMLLDSIYMTAIARNIWELPHLINKGELDFYLTRPASSLFFLMFRSFEFASLLNVALGCGFFGWAVSHYQGDLQIVNVLTSCLLCVNGMILLGCLKLFASIPVFWTQSRFGFHMLSEAFSKIIETPEGVFRGLSHFVLVTALPFLVISSFPAKALFGEADVVTILHSFCVTVLLAGFAVWLWNRGLRVYSSASS